jgi:hypothetical protein
MVRPASDETMSRENGSMVAPRSRLTTARHAARVLLLGFGVAVSALAFVGLLDDRLELADIEPWWYLALIGIVAVLLALGSPRAGRVSND